ncbi:GNAT family N-acetyltransferase [Kibdelosporangium philippinense]|uniref:GNAT family N-acetyltransferase n=1 Tax=Kibdelosporangium philippinense TaxID=211113 RepID=A0ABS8ZLJ4_9PSEU|nr:GNAT family N-acetyltransferase [Kibdelosporangium philippinense]MCE7007496.1 GNAT family N-acetyltransferase [Kibdelosporangium philippinense]
MSEPTIRLATDADFNDVLHMIRAAFLEEIADKDDEWYRTEWEPDRLHLVHDGDELIGTAAVLTLDMTFPGAGPRPFAAVTTVAVKPGHRRRGVMTKLMHAQLHGLHEQSREPVAALWASEGGIYSRFGYGLASHYLRAHTPKGAAFRPGVDVGKDRVRVVSRDEAMPFVTELYDRVAPQRTGWLSRNERGWTHYLWDTPTFRDGASQLIFAIHPDGYVIFRTKRKWGDRGPISDLNVLELAASTPVGTAAIWRFLLDFDLVAEVEAPIPQDDPLVHLLKDPYQVVRKQKDSLWVRIVDVDRALVQRRYSAPLDTVFEVTDELCPWNQGRWRLVVDSAGAATVERTDADADLLVDTADLGSVFLGGVQLSTLAAVGRVRELRPGTLIPAARAFLGDQQPYCPEVF